MIRHNIVVQKASFVLILVVAIMVIQEEGASVFGALQHHEPSLRIFQSLLQINLILFETALSLYIWINIMGAATVAKLLFQPIYDYNREATIIQTMSSSFSAVHGGGGGGDAPDANDDDDDDDDYDHDEDGHGGNIDNNNNTPSPRPRRHHEQHDLVLTEDDDAAAVDSANVMDSNGSAIEESSPQHDDHDDDSNNNDHSHHHHHDNALLTTNQYPVIICSFALDMLLVIFVTLFLFTLASSFTSDNEEEDDPLGIGRVFSRIAAPTFPLVVFFYLLARAFFPLKRPGRGSFWTVVFYTVSAPWFPVTFRDGFIGDIITSSVRPLQDLCFTIFYFLFGLRGWYTSQDSYRDKSFVNEADDNVPAMEKSWIVHTVVLPMCMVSPLWWRFLQNLRQCFDERRRWPYLGNALKYFLAAQVAMLGVFQPQRKKSVLWIGAFVIATLYQVYWDIFMDWELLVYASSSNKNGGRRTWQLRPQRLYPNRCCLYWTICIVNFILRFCWTLSFIPLRYLSEAGILTEAFGGGGGGDNDNSDNNSKISMVLGPIIATAEIVRRGLWGLLRFEWEVIKTSRNSTASKVDDDDDDDAALQQNLTTVWNALP
jgi:hypothetical protein